MNITMLWQDSFSIKIPEIDDQHRKLIDMINALYRAICSNAGSADRDEIINDMTNYAAHHFRTEETYMRTYNFPDLAAHCAEHRMFSDRIAHLRKRSENADSTLYVEMLHFLKFWLQKHIQETDMNYSKYLLDRWVR